MTASSYDVLIIGGGIGGSALLFTLSRYTDIESIALIEKYHDLSQVNSAASNNSQTLHCGDIETNYSLEKAVKVNKAAHMLVRYAEAQENPHELMAQYSKMVLAVGPEECALLKERFERFSPHFPAMKLWEKEDIARLEPAVVKERKEEILAIGVEKAFTAADYYKLAHSFVENAKKETGKRLDVRLGEAVIAISAKAKDEGFTVKTEKGEISARFVVVSAGAHSLLFAQKMGYGLEYSCLPIGGSYYFTPEVLRGKVYTIQNDKLPFAAIHGDPDLACPGATRFGPTAILLPMLERYKLKTIPDFFKVLRFDTSVLRVFLGLWKERDIRRFIIKNVLFEIPWVNKRVFLKDAKKIIPSLTVKDLRFAKGFGGLRPQLIDKKTSELLMGEAKIDTGKGIIFNMTPSPGGTVCLENAYKDATITCEFLKAAFKKEDFEKDFLK